MLFKAQNVAKVTHAKSENLSLKQLNFSSFPLRITSTHMAGNCSGNYLIVTIKPLTLKKKDKTHRWSHIFNCNWRFWATYVKSSEEMTPTLKPWDRLVSRRFINTDELTVLQPVPEFLLKDSLPELTFTKFHKLGRTGPKKDPLWTIFEICKISDLSPTEFIHYNLLDR